MQLINKNLLLTIETTLPDLRPSEQKVARYVIENYRKVIYQTVSELADNSGVSDASVMRFVKKLGFKGFQYFKLALATLQENGTSSKAQNGISLDIKENIKNSIFASINDTFSILEKEHIEGAVKYILGAREIYIVGVGASGAIGRLLSYKLLRIGIIANYISDTHLQAMLASLIERDTLVIGISHSGSTIDTVDTLKIAQSVGAKTICITGHVKSPIVKYSNVLLCTYAREDPLGISQERSCASQIYVIETLVACLHSNLQNKANLARKKTAKSVLDKLY